MNAILLFLNSIVMTKFSNKSENLRNLYSLLSYCFLALDAFQLFNCFLILIILIGLYYFILFLLIGGERNANYCQKASTRLFPLKPSVLISSYYSLINIVHNLLSSSHTYVRALIYMKYYSIYIFLYFKSPHSIV